ncbi:MAG: FHA domain-containing protein [Fimbriimonadaceae bacterium]|jgi:pSer/pThr/pTyr-binding forkhead associated (FHA) protein|nr:FHA domain-containing protein [Fimbriimonadaceae bacterium]
MNVFVKAMILGAVGFLAWLVNEPFLPKTLVPNDPAWARQELILLVTFVLLVSLAAGVWNGFQKGGASNIMLQGFLGLFLGGVGGLIGYSLGGALFRVILGEAGAMGVNPIMEVLGRSATFAVMGGCLGAGVGAAQMAKRPILAGLFGGVIAGLISGVLFVWAGMLLAAPAAISGGENAEVGALGRGILFTLLAFMIGLFTAWIELATRSAWLRLELGRNEGKEWPIDAAQTNIGRDERAHVPLFGDGQVLPLHAVIQKQGNSSYLLVDPTSGQGMGLGLNGARLASPTILNHGDLIQVGQNNLRFLLKSGHKISAQEGRALAMNVRGMSGPTPGSFPAPIQPIVQGQASPMVTQPQGTYRLVATLGPLAGQVYPINGPMDLGREGGAVPLAGDSKVSRRHASLSLSPQGVVVQDLGSTNGTFVNAQRVTNATLDHGDVLQIGNSSFRIERSP